MFFRFTPLATKVLHLLKRYWPSITQLQQFKVHNLREKDHDKQKL